MSFFLMNRFYSEDFYGADFLEMCNEGHQGNYVSWKNIQQEHPNVEIPRKPLEFVGVGYDSSKNIFVFYDRHDNKCHKTEAESKKLCSAKFIKQMKHHCKMNKFYDLKIGNSISVSEVVEDTSLPKVHYQQGDRHYCLACSLASALHYRGYHKQGALVKGQSKRLSECLDARETLKEIMETFMPQYTAVKVAEKTFTFDPWM